MKRKKLTSFLKLGILFFAISLFLWNCEKENLIEEKIELSSKFKVSNVTRFEINSNIKLAEKISKLSKSKKTFAKDTYSSEHNFIINTDLAKYVESRDGNYHSYTFKVTREVNNGALENLLVSLQSDGTYKLFLIQYPLTPEGNLIDTYNVSVEEIIDEELSSNLFARGCKLEFTCVVGCAPSNTCHTDAQCTGAGAFYEVSKNCSGGGGGGDNGTGSGTPVGEEGTGGGGNSSGASTSNSSSNVTSPLIPTRDEIALKELNECLISSFQEAVDNSETMNWLHNQVNEKGSYITMFNDFVKEHGCSDETKKLAFEGIGILKGLDSFKTQIKSPFFNALEDSWLDALRKYAGRLEALKNKIPDILWDNINLYLNRQLITALTKTAFKFNIDAGTTKESNKQHEFENDGKRSIGILLYEFANGTGKDERSFPFEYDMTQQMLAGNVPSDIKANFYDVLNKENLTFDQFVSNVNEIDGSYSFSPDHTSVVDSFEKHKNANWVQFFIGGASIKYYPSNEAGYIIVELTNGTSRNSLLLHSGDSYDRDGSGNNRPLSTIKQAFKFKLKIQ
tara:strand:+ start:101 stop:1795 length:1695 start_codon:yes stop_codon:yes gene_type:complete